MLILLFIAKVESKDGNNGNLKVEVNGFISDEGKARILLFSPKERESFPSYDKISYLKKIVQIKNKQVIYIFESLPYGDYAISVHHDKNNDGKVNTNWIGLPNEGLGCTNDAKGFFGPPSFEQAEIHFRKDTTIIINMVN